MRVASFPQSSSTLLVLAGVLAGAATLFLAAPASATCGEESPQVVRLPRLVLGRVLGDAPGADLSGLSWASWPLSRPDARVDGGPVGFVEPGAFVGDVGMAAASTSLDEPWLAFVEGRVEGRAAFAFSRSPVEQHPQIFPDAHLVPIPVPRAAASGFDVVVRWDAAARADGTVIGPADGLEAYAVVRAPAGTESWREVGRVPADGRPLEVVDRGVSPGRWSYGVAIVPDGGVRGEAVAPADEVTFIGLSRLGPRPVETEPPEISAPRVRRLR